MEFRNILFTSFINENTEVKPQIVTNETEAYFQNEILKLETFNPMSFYWQETHESNYEIFLLMFYYIGTQIAAISIQYVLRNFSFKMSIIISTIFIWMLMGVLKAFPIGFLCIGVVVLGFFFEIIKISAKFILVENSDFTPCDIEEITNLTWWEMYADATTQKRTKWCKTYTDNNSAIYISLSYMISLPLWTL